MGRKLLGIGVWLLALFSAWLFMGHWFAPDACLDFGGSFNYRAWECSYTENQQFIEVPAYHLKSFWFFIASSSAATVVSAWLLATRRAT